MLALEILAILMLAYAVYRFRRFELRLKESLPQVVQEALARQWQQFEFLRIVEAELDFHGRLPVTRGWAASPDLLLHLVRRVLRNGAKVILECGAGASTVAMAKALQRAGGGHLYALEHQRSYLDNVAQWLAEVGLSGYVTLIHAPLVAHQFDGETWSWYDRAKLPAGNFDLILVDGPPAVEFAEARYPAGPLLLPRLAAGGALFLDDADRAGEKEVLRRWRLLFPGYAFDGCATEKGCAVIARPRDAAADTPPRDAA
jgi:predicted O-methyltransferase YrrM